MLCIKSVIDERKDATSSSGISDESVNENADGTTAVDPFLQLETLKKIGFNELNLTARGRQWETDLRMFPPLNFHQLYEYLVVRTQKYEEGVMKGVSHKKMKSYQFFKEGHIKTYEIARGFGKVWVKSKVVALMKHEMYRIIVVCKDDGIKRAGKCNHLGGLLFALNDFHEKGLHQRTERVSCTSKLNGWIVPRNLTVKPKPLKEIKVKKEIDDKIEVDKNFIDKFVTSVIENEKNSDDEIKHTEKITRGQSENIFWKKIHQFKATTSNFGRIIKCSKNPDGLLKTMFYSYSEPYSLALTYGKENKSFAIEAYILYKKSQGIDVTVESVGTILSKDRPGFGASLDGMVCEPSSDVQNGGLEVKCPISKVNMSLDNVCSDTSFYLTKSQNGQKYVANLKWVDFVVRFGSERELFVQRITFDSETWFRDCLPKLDLFYKWAVVPELLTRRVKRKLQLISKTRWKTLKNELSIDMNS
ncbi:unnamed protein product [Mytilus coruscus]|uniref:YqaJ viral recombinase domain-containing protein n=1 Tax=Mytilus coruscus TaxID=42192 RepID=A0A6J8EC97_MYTCO|nr:unnamed protein product [Mytilus coruscus]